MRRALSILLLAVAATAATSAAAQQPPARTNDDGQSLGLRYLTWPGRITSARNRRDRTAVRPRSWPDASQCLDDPGSARSGTDCSDSADTDAARGPTARGIGFDQSGPVDHR